MPASPFTRLGAGTPTPQILSDMYDKLAQLSVAGPGAGVYTICPALTMGGKPGTITLNASGQVTAIQAAS